ncbi:hypothetical protein [Limnohabitans sp. WS1]|uniref:hypothetical protein n=1 Tax=Limnohabitans sp. WS1 TaxID=1100726 RepID=UPI0011B2717A|nr:hypothetical protein [Limnohabitans sp. WS1]
MWLCPVRLPDGQRQRLGAYRPGAVRLNLQARCLAGAGLALCGTVPGGFRQWLGAGCHPARIDATYAACLVGGPVPCCVIDCP